MTLSALLAQAAAPSETLLPATTKGFVSTANLISLQAQWDKTQLGQLMKDPLMKPFSDDLTGQLRERFAQTYAKLGLSWEDVKDVPSGEVAMARIQPAPGKAALVMVADVTGRGQQVDALAKKITTNLLQQAAKQSEKKVGQVTITCFELPKQDDEEQKRAYYFRTDTLLVTADDKAVIEEILSRAMGGGDNRTLANVPAFRAVMARCQREVGQRTPQVRWFVEPFGYGEVLEVVNPERFGNRRKGKSVLEVLKGQGFTAVQGMGGFVDFAVDGFEVLHRTVVYAPPPYEKSAKMLVLPNRRDFAPQPWVPRDVANYLTAYADVLNAFEHFGPLFDDLFGDGEKGVWQEVLDGLMNDPNGPQIDLRKELVGNLGQRVTMISDYELPITPDSERLLYAVEAVDVKAVADGIAKMMENDPTVRRREFEGHVIWETVEQTGRKPLRKPVVGGVKPLVPERPDQQEPAPRLLPTAAVTVAYGQLFVASHIEFLKKVLQQPAKGDSLGQRLDFKLVDATLNRFGVLDNCARYFSRTDEEYRPTYELTRQGKMPQSKTMLARALNQFLGSGKKGSVRKQQVAGQKMPDFQVVRRYLGPGGMLAYSEPDGWFLTGFMLKK